MVFEEEWNLILQKMTESGIYIGTEQKERLKKMFELGYIAGYKNAVLETMNYSKNQLTSIMIEYTQKNNAP